MGGPLTNRAGAFLRRGQSSLSVLTEEKPCEKAAFCKAGREPSPDAELT